MSLNCNTDVAGERDRDEARYAPARLRQIGDFSTGSMLVDTAAGTVQPGLISRQSFAKGERPMIAAVVIALFCLAILNVSNWHELWLQMRGFLSIGVIGGLAYAGLVMYPSTINGHEVPKEKIFFWD